MSIRLKIGKLAQKIYRRCMELDECDLHEESLNALTPTLLTDEEFKLYAAEFFFVFSNPKIRNVALMGSYGAGKSSVIETWDEKQKQNGKKHTSTFISLAHFHGSNGDTNAIEGEILNQLIHKTDPRHIPKSRFKHTKDNSGILDLIKTIWCVAFGFLTIILLALLVRDGIVLSDGVALTHPWLTCVWLIGFATVAYFAIRKNKTDRLLRRIKLFGNEVELFDYSKEQGDDGKGESHDPIFNRYMDDVLYLLNNSGSDVFVFEDLDRFDDSIEIFEKLRELNELANACRSNKRKTLRFFYLIREDLFATPEDRVKFFDFIIPIIPFADPDGNYDELRIGLRNLGLSVSDLFVYELSAFIPDSRALKEIVNEVKHYKEHIFCEATKPLTEEEAEHLVAIIVYKVVFPTDFSHYQHGKGYVAELLKRRDKLIETRREKLLAKKESIEKEILEIDEKSRFTIEELAFISCGGASKFDQAISSYSSPISQKDSLEEMLGAVRSNERASDLLDEEIAKYSANEERQKRFGAPKDRLEKRKQECLIRIQEIEEELAQLNCCTLGELSRELNDDSIFALRAEDLERNADFDDCEIESVLLNPHFPLLKHLLITDLIDASSMRYVIRLRPEGLSLADQRNLATIQGRRPIDPGYVFDKPGDVLMRIRDEYLMVPGAQNYSLLKEILDKRETGKLAKFVTGLQRADHAAFLLGYTLSDQFVPDAFSIAEDSFDNELADILSNEVFPKEQRRIFAHSLICNKEKWHLDNTEKAILEFANSDADFLFVDEDLIEGVKANLSDFRFALSDINFTSADNGLLSIIYKEALYEPNALLVAKWVEYRFPYHVVNRHSIISTVFSLPDENLHHFVESNMEVFVSSVLETNSELITESEDVLVWVLNALSNSHEVVVLFVSNLENCSVRDLGRVEDASAKRALLLFDIPNFSAKNILEYFHTCDDAIDDALVAYVHKHLESGNYQQIELDSLSDSEDLVSAAIENASLTDEDVRALLAGSGSAILANFAIDNLDQSRIAVVLRSNRVPVTVDNVQFIREHYSNCEYLLADSDIDAYLALFNTDSQVLEFDESVGLKILESDCIIPAKKIEASKLFETPIHLKEAYPDLLKVEIVDNHFEESDLPLLSREYENGGKQLRESIRRRSLANIDEFVAQNLALSCELLCALLEGTDVADSDKLELIAFQLNLDDTLINDRSSVKKCFEAAGAQKYVRLIDGKKISVPADTVNSKVVNALMKHGMSSEKGVEEGANGYVIVSPKGYERKRISS